MTTTAEGVETEQQREILRKLGCTQLFTADGTVERVTVIQAGPVFVLDKRTPEKNGYSALVLAFGERKEKHATKPLLGQFKKHGTTPKRTVWELRCTAEFAAKFEVGAPMKLELVGPRKFLHQFASTASQNASGAAYVPGNVVRKVASLS